MKYIEIEKLYVNYESKNSKEALQGLDLNVYKGQIYGFLGPNGAGKTTTIKIILGLIPRYKGKVLIMGASPDNLSVKQKIGFMPEIANYYWYLTPRELLYMYAQIFGISKKNALAKIEKLIDLSDLKDAADNLMRTFSKGMMQKVSFAQALINDPDLLILDEPTRGIDVPTKVEVHHMINALAAQGLGIILISSDLPEVLAMGDRVLVMREGRQMGLFDRKAATQEKIMTAAMGHNRPAMEAQP